MDDTDAIAAYHHRCWVIAFSSLLAPGMVDRMDPRGKIDRWRNWLAPKSGFVTAVADLSGTPIGHTTVAGYELVHLFVDPDHWGQGVGRKLLEVGEGLLRSDGHREIELNTMVGNERALSLYCSAGWVVTSRVVHTDQDGVVYDEHVLVKRLD
ncbi:MAG: GNAT family N-acetyltransferase [Actinomycetota bacterium]|nr:GNAT family N-acetyltransferase [Actinomycetota bacterium]